MTEPARHRLFQVAAMSFGAAVPSLFAGRVPMAVFLALGFLALLAAAPRLFTWRLAAEWDRYLAPAVGVTLALWLISVAGSLMPAVSIETWSVTAVSLVGATVLYGGVRAHPAMIPVFQRTLLVCGLFGSLVGVIAIYLWPPFLELFRDRTVETAAAAGLALKAYGSVMPCLAPLMVWAGWTLGGPWRGAALLSLPLGLAIVLGADSAAGLLGYAAAGLAWLLARLLITLPQTLSRLLAGGALLAALGVVFVIVSSVPSPPYECESLPLPEWLVDAHRQVIWGFAFDRGLEAPWFGHGIDVGGHLPGASTPLPCIGQNYLPSHAHNWMFEFFVETGVVGFATVVVALAVFARLLVRHAFVGRPGVWAAIALAGAFWGSALVNFSIWAVWWQWVFLSFTAVLLAAGAVADRRTSDLAGA